MHMCRNNSSRHIRKHTYAQIVHTIPGVCVFVCVPVNDTNQYITFAPPETAIKTAMRSHMRAFALAALRNRFGAQRLYTHTASKL